MSAEESRPDPKAIGIFLIVAFAAFNLLQLAFLGRQVASKTFLGPFLVEGPTAVAWIGVSPGALIAVALGLLRRRPWGRFLGITYFGLQAGLLVAAVSVWVANPEGAAEAYRKYAGPGNYVMDGRAALQIFLTPSLVMLTLTLAATTYLWKNKALFHVRESAGDAS